MRRTKLPHKKKFRFLLDSAFAQKDAFPKLNKKASLAHVVTDCGLSYQCEDSDIYEMAIRENRFVLTINFKDFKKLVKKGKSGIIGIESQLTNKEIDLLVVNFISGKDPKNFIGRAIKIQLNKL